MNQRGAVAVNRLQDVFGYSLDGADLSTRMDYFINERTAHEWKC